MDQLITQVISLAQHAGAAILKLYGPQPPQVITKIDGSPVTQADLIANNIIVNGLLQLTPEIPILSEELPAPPFNERTNWNQYWLVDPLDGTQQFIKHTDEFTVNIALIQHNYPVFGLIYIPTTQTCYFAHSSIGAFKQIANYSPSSIHSRHLPTKPHILTNNRQNEGKIRSHFNMFPALEITTVSSAIKYGLVAEGTADLFPCLSPTCEWDTAAGQCIVECAGGRVIDFSGERLRYNSKDSLINPHFIVLGDSKNLLSIVLDWRK